MTQTIFKVAEERFNSGNVFTGMTEDGLEVTDGYGSYCEAFEKLILGIKTQGSFELEIPLDVEASVSLPNTHPFNGDFELASLLEALAPSLKVESMSDEDIEIGLAFHELQRQGLKEQVEKQFKGLIELSSAFPDTLHQLNECRLHMRVSIQHASLSKLMSIINPEPSYQVQEGQLSDASFGTRLCVAMACGYFSTFKTKISLKKDKNNLTLSVIKVDDNDSL